MKKKLLKVLGTTLVWGLIYWGLMVNVGESWLNMLVYLAFVVNVFVIASEE